MKTLPSFIDEMLAAPPRAGEGNPRRRHPRKDSAALNPFSECETSDCPFRQSNQALRDGMTNQHPRY